MSAAIDEIRIQFPYLLEEVFLVVLLEELLKVVSIGGTRNDF